MKSKPFFALFGASAMALMAAPAYAQSAESDEIIVTARQRSEALQDVPALEIGGGLSTVEAGLRLRYEIRREFAPYAGVSWTRSVGDTADFARASAGDPSSVSFVAGVRFWF